MQQQLVNVAPVLTTVTSLFYVLILFRDLSLHRDCTPQVHRTKLASLKVLCVYVCCTVCMHVCVCVWGSIHPSTPCRSCVVQCSVGAVLL